MTPWPRARNVTAVAQPSAARTKNCQGWSRRPPWRPASADFGSTDVGSGFSRTLGLSRGFGAHRRVARPVRRSARAERLGALAVCWRDQRTATKPTSDAAPSRRPYTESSHASRLKPLSIGAPSISWLPYFVMNAWMISSCDLALSISAASSPRIWCDVRARILAALARCSCGRSRRCRRSRAAAASRTALRA